jgi:hypothetical protein
MPTPKQIAASRAKAQKNTGTLTSADNAKHGADLEAQILPGETAEDLAQLAAEFREKFSPADATERFLVDTMIHNQWRLRRMLRVEAVLWEQALGKNMALDARSSRGAFTTTIQALDRLQRIIDSCQSNYHRALKELISVQRARVKNRRTQQPAQPRAAVDAAQRDEEAPKTIEPFDSSFQTLFKQ